MGSSPNSERGQRRKAPEARDALVRGSDRRERALLEVPVGAEALPAELAALGEHDQRALGKLALAHLDREEALRNVERGLRRGEEDLVTPCADPKRPPDAPCQEGRRRPSLVEPGGRHRAAQLLERLRRA